jgi:hypothetical protein
VPCRVQDDLAAAKRRPQPRVVGHHGRRGRDQRREAVLEHRRVVLERDLGTARTERASGRGALELIRLVRTGVAGRRDGDPGVGQAIEALVKAGRGGGIDRRRLVGEAAVQVAVDEEPATVAMPQLVSFQGQRPGV